MREVEILGRWQAPLHLTGAKPHAHATAWGYMDTGEASQHLGRVGSQPYVNAVVKPLST